MKVIMRGAAEWALGNPVLAVDEIGVEAVRVDNDGSLVFETDSETGQAVAKFKSGDGANSWNALPYVDRLLFISKDDYLEMAEAAKKLAQEALDKASTAEKTAASAQEATKPDTASNDDDISTNKTVSPAYLTARRATKTRVGLVILAADDDRDSSDKVPTSAGVAKQIRNSQQILWCQDEQSSTTPGGTFPGGSWRTRDLNTVKENTIVGASLNSNQITLPEGDYWIEASAPAFTTNQHRTRLYDITNSIPLLVGTMEYSWNSTGASPSRSFVIGKISLERTTVLELQHYALATSINTNGFGMIGTSAFAGANVFAQFTARRLL